MLLKITAETSEDLVQHCLDLNRELLRHLGSKPRPGIRETVDQIRSGQGPASLFLWMKEGKALGMAYANLGQGLAVAGRYCWLNGIYLQEECRQRGEGTAFLSALTTWAKEEGCVYMIASRDAWNEASGNLFQSQGFSQESMVLMDKWLD